ncbi:MAG: hypothetical protein CMB67_05005 [Euryarchaeota archaeon]|nr:hypothetical protein [Euryarchaeota archaeon]
MRRASILAMVIILASSMPVIASSKGVISCISTELGSLPGNWSLDDQSCIRVDLGEHDPGTTLNFEISSDQEVDILLFPSNTVSVYQNEQSYRMDSVWMSDSVFETFSGSGQWHWEVPSDRDSTRWYLVIDNLDHPEDSGEGSQGGQSAAISLDGGVIIHDQFTLSDSIHRVSPNDFEVVHGPFSVDEGTFVEIHARTMQGSPDIFVMSETAFSYYSPSSNWSSSLRIASADMLRVTNEMYSPWEAEGTNGEELYIVVDNRPGPGGGGPGNSPIAVTVTVTLTPILSPSITSEADLESVDVGSAIVLSSSETPNKSNQIPDSGFKWDTNGDGITDYLGAAIEQFWEEPGNYSVTLSVTSLDSRTESISKVITVVDLSDPEISMGTLETVTKGFGEQLSISASFSDNWEVQSLDWLLDGSVLWSNYSLSDLSSTLVLEVENSYSPGPHVISLVVVDKSGRSTKKDVQAIFIDVTSPEISNFESQIQVDQGTPVILQIFAQDNESQTLKYTWTLEMGTENEVEFPGFQVIHQFNTEGPHNVVCKVENDAGLSSYAEILVIVNSRESENGLGLKLIAAFSIIVLLIISAGAFFFFNNAVGRRMSELTEPEEEEDEEPESPTPPTAQMQKQMWGGADASPFQHQSFESTPAEPSPEILQLLEVEEKGELEPRTNQESRLLDELTTFPEQEEKVDHSENRVRKKCENCSKPFEILLPEGVEQAYTNCPYCNSEELVSVRDAL